MASLGSELESILQKGEACRIIMKEKEFYNAFIGELNARIPQKSVLVNTLADLLAMEKESVYRRLRGDVCFTLKEAVTLANNFHISLDKLIFDINSPDTHSFHFNWILDGDVDANEQHEMNELLNYVKSISALPDSECGFALNSFSAPLLAMHESLIKYLHFTRIYRQDRGHYIHYESVTQSESYQKMIRSIYVYMTKFRKIFYVLDFQIIANLVSDIKYFEHIKLITHESIGQLKKDLLAFLQRLEVTAFTGQPYERKGEFKMYITNTHILQTCSYIGAQDHYLSILNAIGRQTCTSTEEDNYLRVRKWIKGLTKLSSQISVAGEKERIEFFEKQKEIVSEM